MAATTAPGTHIEQYTSLVTGRTIAVVCHCAINTDHRYADWVAMTEDRRRPLAAAS